MNDEALKESLGELAESVRNVDLYDRALTRSRRIGRRRAAASTGAALAVLGLVGAGLWSFQPREPDVRPPVLASPALPTPTTAPSAPATSPSAPPASRTTKSSPPSTPALAVPRSRSLADLPGRVFYRGDDGTVVRLTGAGTRTTVLNVPNQAVAVSPDGKRIAYVANDQLLLAGSDQPIYHGTVSTDQQIPAWSPDGTKLLIGTPKPGALTVATGALASLPSGGRDFRWSGDGRKLIYGTTPCRLHVAAAGAGSGTVVPILGDPESSRNPDQAAACRPLSADRTGRQVTVPLQGVGDSAYGDTADTLVDTATGAVLRLPVGGAVRSVLFGPDGNLLIRADLDNRSTLSVLTPDGTLLVQANEPAALRNLLPVAYTR
jgi:TolB protein